MPHKSLKAIDLKRDPRCAIHSAVANKENKEGDFKLSGIANEILDESLFKILADIAERGSGWRPPFRSAFYVTIDVKSASYVNSPKRQVLVWEEVSGLREMTTAGVGD